MKKIFTTTALTFTVIASAVAQTAQIKIKAREAEIPVKIVESFKRDYKGVEHAEWAIVPAVLVGEEYVVSGYDNLNGEKPTSYEVSIKGANVKSRAIYDKNGILKYSREVITDTALPLAVRDAISKKYPGFAVLKDQEVVRQGKSKVIHYKVVTEKGTEKMTLAVDPSGKILKEIKQSRK
jgi:hypothetical protein